MAQDINYNILVAMPDTEVRRSFFPPQVMRELEQLGRVTWNSGTAQYSGEELAERLQGMDIVFTGWGTPKLEGPVLHSAQALKILAHTGGSVGNIASPGLYGQGVRVISGNDVYALSVAEGTIAYILLALRRLPLYMGMAKTEGWHPGHWFNEGLLGQSVGLVGFGAIARHLVALLKPFGAAIKVYSGHLTKEEAAALGVQKAGLEEIFETCKIVSLHGASGPAAHHMVGRALLDRMQDNALFVNTARGSIVDEAALADVLKEKRIQAVLDVFETEPLPMESPLRGLDNVYVIPHMAGPTIDRRPLVTRRLMENIRAFAAGKPMDAEVGATHAGRMSV